MGYDGILLKNSVDIGKIFSIHYFEYRSDFSFEGESHDFWELLCVDRGEVSVTAGNKRLHLKQGDITFHEPNEFHDVQANGTTPPNLVVISFECHSKAMNFFRKQILSIDDTERSLLANIIIEARRSFDCRLGDPYLQNMPRKKSEFFASEQLIRLYLEQFLIHLIRKYSTPVLLEQLPTLSSLSSIKKSDAEVFFRIADYLKSHLSAHLTIDKICKDCLIGRSQLQKLFRLHCSMGIIEYFSLMKVDAAKEMIRQGRLNFTQVSEHLGYTSIHYFSRQFKKLTGMTPSEYASSIKAMAEGSFS